MMKKTFFALLVVATGFACSEPAHAAFVLTGTLAVEVTDGTHTLTVVDGDANDTDTATNAISVRTTALMSTFNTGGVARLSGAGSSVSVSSNQLTAGTDGFSALSSTSILVAPNSASTPLSLSYTITTGQLGFIFPGDTKAVDTSGSFVFTNEGTTGTASFQGLIGPANESATPLPLADTLILATSTSNTTNAASGNGAGFPFINANGTYSIENVQSLDLHKNGRVQNIGTTTVTHSPEPSTLVLLGTFGVPLALGWYRRRRTAS